MGQQNMMFEQEKKKRGHQQQLSAPNSLQKAAQNQGNYGPNFHNQHHNMPPNQMGYQQGYHNHSHSQTQANNRQQEYSGSQFDDQN